MKTKYLKIIFYSVIFFGTFIKNSCSLLNFPKATLPISGIEWPIPEYDLEQKRIAYDLEQKRIAKEAIERVQPLIDAAGGDIDQALLDEIKKENYRVLRSLIAARANINAKDENGYTPLHNAILSYNMTSSLEEDKREKALDLAKILLENGADKNLETEIKDIPLFEESQQSPLSLARKYANLYKDDLPEDMYMLLLKS